MTKRYASIFPGLPGIFFVVCGVVGRTCVLRSFRANFCSSIDRGIGFLYQKYMEIKNLYNVLPAKIVLHATQSPVNFGQVLRSCEMFNVWLKIYDPTGAFQDENKWKTISDFSAGAVQRASKKLLIDDFEAYRKAAQRLGRFVVTCLDKDAIPVQNFRFEAHDAILIGNEYDGLPTDLIETADEKLYIPMAPGYVPKPVSFSPIDPKRQAKGEVSQQGLPNLSVSQTATIIAYKIFEQRMQIPEVQRALAQFRSETC